MIRPRVVVADDHLILAEGLRSLLEPEFELVDIAGDGRELVESARRVRPDVIVADISMPLLNGLEAIEQLRKAGCGAKVVFLTMHKDPDYARRALKAGASGFVVKRSAGSELLSAIRAALGGQTYISPEVQETLDRLPATRTAADDVTCVLTPRQREILQLFAEGLSAKDVAAKLNIARRTAENHKARIMAAIGANSSTELVHFAIRHGIIRAD